jgi:hypothetical protein
MVMIYHTATIRDPMNSHSKPPRIPAAVREILRDEGYGEVTVALDQWGVILVQNGDRLVSSSGDPEQAWYDLVSDARFPPESETRRDFYDLVERLRENGRQITIIGGLVPRGWVHDKERGQVASGRTGREMLESLRAAFPDSA